MNYKNTGYFDVNRINLITILLKTETTLTYTLVVSVKDLHTKRISVVVGHCMPLFLFTHSSNTCSPNINRHMQYAYVRSMFVYTCTCICEVHSVGCTHALWNFRVHQHDIIYIL